MSVWNAVGAGIAGATSLIGGAMANSANKRIAREQNALNYKMFQEQNQFNIDMWNKQNAYNTPKAQMERYKDAGVNPYFALGNVTGGTAQGVTSASPAPAVGYQYQDPIGPAVSTAVNAYVSDMQAQKMRSERDLTVENVISQRIDNAVRAKRNGLEMDNIESQTNLNKSNAELSDKQAQLADENIKRLKEMTPLEVQKVKTEIKSIESTIKLTDTEEALKRFELDKGAPARTNFLIAAAFKAYKDGQLSAAMVPKVVAEAELARAQGVGIRWDNETKRALSANLNKRVKMLDDKLAKEIDLADKQALKAGADADYSNHKRVFDWFKLYAETFTEIQGNAAKALGTLFKK